MRSLRNQRGAAVVEFALLFVFLLLPIVIGIIDFGFGWVQSHYIENAAREGARVAAKLEEPEVNGSDDQDAVYASVQGYLDGLYDDVSDCCDNGDFIEVVINSATIDPGGMALPASRVTVTVRTADYWDPILPAFLIDFPDTLTKTSVFAKELN